VCERERERERDRERERAVLLTGAIQKESLATESAKKGLGCFKIERERERQECNAATFSTWQQQQSLPSTTRIMCSVNN
jgi:hypothetical protein